MSHLQMCKYEKENTRAKEATRKLRFNKENTVNIFARKAIVQSGCSHDGCTNVVGGLGDLPASSPFPVVMPGAEMCPCGMFILFICL